MKLQDSFRMLAQTVEAEDVDGLVSLMTLQENHAALQLKSFWYLLQSRVNFSRRVLNRVMNHPFVPYIVQKLLEDISVGRNKQITLVYSVDALEENTVLGQATETLLGDKLKHLL